MKPHLYPDIGSIHSDTQLYTQRRQLSESPKNYKFTAYDLYEFYANEYGFGAALRINTEQLDIIPSPSGNSIDLQGFFHKAGNGTRWIVDYQGLGIQYIDVSSDANNALSLGSDGFPYLDLSTYATEDWVSSNFDDYGYWELQAEGGAKINVESGDAVEFKGTGATVVTRIGHTIKIASTDSEAFLPTNHIAFGSPSNAITSQSGFEFDPVNLRLTTSNTLSDPLRIGLNAGHNVIGFRNTFLGQQAGYFGTPITINNITATGYFAARNNTGNNITASGYFAARNNTGDIITATGSRAANNNTGNNITATGYYAADQNTGDNITATGSFAANNNTGNNITATGYYAARDNEGSDVIGIGTNALRGNTKDGNIGIGIDAFLNNTTVSNSIILGNNLTATKSDQVVLGGSTEEVYIQGVLGIKTDNPSEAFDVDGKARIRGTTADSTLTNMLLEDANGVVHSRAISGLAGTGLTYTNNQLNIDNPFNPNNYDNYQNWKAKVGAVTEDILSGQTLEFEEGTNIGLSWNNGKIKIDATQADLTGYATENWVSSNFDDYRHWELQAEGGAKINVESGDAVEFKGTGATVVSRIAREITIHSTDTNTEYTAGAGIKLTGTEFSLDGTLGDVNVQSDWNVTDVNSDAYILNKPSLDFDKYEYWEVVVDSTTKKIYAKDALEYIEGDNITLEWENDKIKISSAGGGGSAYDYWTIYDDQGVSINLEDKDTLFALGGDGISTSLKSNKLVITNNSIFDFLNLKTNGVQREQIINKGSLDIIAGTNVTVDYIASGGVKISAAGGGGGSAYDYWQFKADGKTSNITDKQSLELAQGTGINISYNSSTRKATISATGSSYDYWNLKTNGVQRKQIGDKESLDIIAGTNVTVDYVAAGGVKISAAGGGGSALWQTVGSGIGTASTDKKISIGQTMYSPTYLLDVRPHSSSVDKLLRLYTPSRNSVEAVFQNYLHAAKIGLHENTFFLSKEATSPGNAPIRLSMNAPAGAFEMTNDGVFFFSQYTDAEYPVGTKAYAAKAQFNGLNGELRKIAANMRNHKIFTVSRTAQAGVEIYIFDGNNNATLTLPSAFIYPGMQFKVVNISQKSLTIKAQSGESFHPLNQNSIVLPATIHYGASIEIISISAGWVAMGYRDGAYN